VSTPAACLIGWPAAHSRSPLIHKYWLKSFGIDGDYRIEAVEPNAFAKFIASLEAARLSGRQCHHSAQGAGARADACGRMCNSGRRSNTLADNDGELRSTNTDVEASSAISMPAPRAGMARMMCFGARRGRLRARGDLRPDRARHRACIWPTAPRRARRRWRSSSARR
jgi:shikimate 5-dehydrogenase